MFTKLVMGQAYQQLILDDDSKVYVVINTHKGLFRYKRLPFGIASAPGIFHRTIEGVLREIPRISVYLDDILIMGRTEEHLATLDKVLSRFQEAGLCLRREKCSFFKPSVDYLGHRIDAEGLHPLPDRVKAVGLINYYGKFLPDLSKTLA